MTTLSMPKLTLLVALAGCAAAPAAPEAPSLAAAAEEVAGPLVMKMRAVRQQDGEAPFQINDALRNGDRIAYYVTTDRPAYVYVLQFTSDGAPHLLFPPAGDQRVPGKRETRVPPAGQWLELEGATGTENVYVVATIEPLTEADRELAALISDVRTSPGAAPPEPEALPHAPAAPADPPEASGADVSLALTEGLRSSPSAPAAKPAPRPQPAPTSGRIPPDYLALLRNRSIGLAPCDPSSGLRCRALKLVGASYEGTASDEGVVVLHFPFRHVE